MTSGGFVAGGAEPAPGPALSTWYVYADGFGRDGRSPGDCQAAGHADGECSVVFKPPPGPTPFPYVGDAMCSSGIAAKITASVDGVGLDYDNIWGAGIGLDFTSNGVPTEFDAVAHGVIGITFRIDNIPNGFRVEFPTSSRDPRGGGWDYWGANSSYPPSPVKPGLNRVLWTEVNPPQGGRFDPYRWTGIQFHVSTHVGFPTPYSFCISEFRLLTN
jgi:hypothetical protein